MPGMLHHMFFGKVVLEGLETVSDLKIKDRRAFMAGNIIPDKAKRKDGAHYYCRPENGFYYPDMKLVWKALEEVRDPSLRLGIEAHYYLDEWITRGFLEEHFDYDAKTGIVRKIWGNEQWTLGEFFSPKGLYRGYGECNGLLIRDGMIDMDWIMHNVPEILPKTGIPILDEIAVPNWLDELKWMLESPPDYTGKILVYGEFVDFIKQCAAKFIFAEHA